MTPPKRSCASTIPPASLCVNGRSVDGGLDELQAVFPDARRELIPGQRHIGHVFAARAFADLVADFFDSSGN
jgi:hypothetical protein